MVAVFRERKRSNFKIMIAVQLFSSVVKLSWASSNVNKFALFRKEAMKWIAHRRV